ncbi:MAG: bifunctional demethylmenaquinone methyltransferase/2-methoxy-6-polyprenyl-1,4-benzoquinol methylase UbiE [Thermodesulfovibrionales bacterium]|nr:bifunctional demethylmenaquinone methyltransferase/2-methoxy-6-polyprenyl-1,4-benzoquinol methylase UbiE [Thermodesulfovibrionales bacterium]
MNYIAKKEFIMSMFDRIAKYYDFLNHLLSLNMDKRWRKKAIDILADFHPKIILDVATGTADLAIEAVRLNPDKILGIDISEKMLSIAKEKITKRGLSNKIELQRSDSESIPFPDETFDAVTVAFGVRNFEDLQKGLKEMYRVTKKDGWVVILEFSRPYKFPFDRLYNLYFNSVLPIIGGTISKDKGAYKYLPLSVSNFPDGLEFLRILEKIGFKNLLHIPLSLGICTIYRGQK